MISSLVTIIIDSNKNSRKTLGSVVRTHLGIKKLTLFEGEAHTLGHLDAMEKLDLVFIDFESLGKVPLDLIKAIKSNFSHSKIQFILMTANKDETFLVDAATNGISAIIEKPYNSAAVISKIKSLFKSTARRSSRLNIYKTMPIYLAFDKNKFNASLVDISSNGCKIKVKGFKHKGIEIYDSGLMKIPFDDNSLVLDFELVRLESDVSSDEKWVFAALNFKSISAKNGAIFAQLWAHILGQRKP